MDDLLADFLTETNEALAECDTALVRLEQAPGDTATLAQIFRLVHTIKGTCGFLGLPRLEKVAHAAENLLGRFRDAELAATPERISLVLRALDAVRAIVTTLERTQAEPAGDDLALIAALDAACHDGVLAQAPGAMRPEQPAAIAVMSAPAREAALAPAAAAPADAVGPAAADPGFAAQTIRVHVDVLEDLMTLVSELVLTRNQLLQLVRREHSAPFAVPLQRLSHITSELQEGVMKTRMQPIGQAWAKLPRLVRDLARDVGKKIELVQMGADTELDRQVLELIKDPLTHMVRNSADHGLETPEQRRAAGKPETGRITLSAFHEGGYIIIGISDDGRGLAIDRIRAKVIAGGLATEAELDAMSEQQIQQFIFRPGFSTAANVTSVSGRGVGMDVVRTNIERIGGTIELRSVAGKGTSFTIRIPLTLAIVSALIVEAGGERFAIPQLSVVELVRAGGEAGSTIEHINETPVLRLRDRLLPLVSLSRLLALDAGVAPEAGTPAFIVVAQVGPHGFGIIVDRVFDTEEIVVKPVAPILRHLTLFSGNTILGDGSVIMILDPNGIAQATGVGGSRAAVAPPAPPDARRIERTTLLLFRAGDATPKAAPLGLIARLENFPRDAIETAGGGPVIQYRGRLMKLVAPPGIDRDTASQPVLVFADDNRSMGLMVDEILDVVEDRLEVELSTSRPGLLGSAVIAGRAVEVLDAGFWLRQAFSDWFERTNAQRRARARPHLLVVEDSQFFRDLLAPLLTSAGYEVTTADNGAAALRLRDQGHAFDCIVSDIEMPELDGFGFIRAVRAGGAWAGVPAVALSSRTDPADLAAGRAAGFTSHVGKFDRDAVLAAVAGALSQREGVLA
jgi:two-component system chemotaxis sensor kinase CheA